MRLTTWPLLLSLASFAFSLPPARSTDGTCGVSNGATCIGSMYGNCCSKDGKCGSTAEFCGSGCQSKYGYCSTRWGNTSPDGTCGKTNGYTCKDSLYGGCCSEFGFCGSNSEHCGTGCDSRFGDCTLSIKARNFPSTLRKTPRPTPKNDQVLARSDPTSSNNNYGVPVIKTIVVDVTMTGTTTKTASLLSSSGVAAASSEQSHVSSSRSAYGSASTNTITTIGQYSSAGGAYTSSLSSTLSPFGTASGTVSGVSTIIGISSSSGYSNHPSSSGGVFSSSASSWSVSSVPASGSFSSSTATLVGSSSIPSAVMYAVSQSYTTSIVIDSTSSSSSATSSGHSNSVSGTLSTQSLSRTSSIITSASSQISSTASSGSTTISSTISHTTVSSSIVSTRSPTSTAACIPCEGQPGKNPETWCGLDINTNYYKEVPKTCRTVRYTLEITNTTVAPDGIPRIGLLVNGTMPGPTIEANWGDTVEVTVINRMQNNGTSIHFHGIRQNFTNQQDGVPSITQCPIAPGDQLTYTWVASQYGTSWYHSHFALQAWEGVYGPMVIHGPHSAAYDIDAGPIVLQDWTHATVDSMYDLAQDAVLGGPRVMDNGLINGMNTWGADGTVNQTGKRFEMEFQPGKSYLLRLVNVAIQSTFKFYIDGHTMTVISTDFSPIEPYETNILNINIGQRYNVIVRANQPSRDYWMRSDNQNTCARTIQATDIKGIVRYVGAPRLTPTTTSYNYTGACIDEPLASLIPVVPLDATDSDISMTKDVTVAANSAKLFKWYLSGTTFQSEWGDPTLLALYNNKSEPTYSGNLIIDLPKEKEWVYVIIESAIPLPHPIHLHGHDFFILASGAGTYSASSTQLNLKNPPRRDTALMPGAGYLVLAFETDNPGVWLMHCHIGWHTSMGFALQFVEMKDRIGEAISDGATMQGTCAEWNSYAKDNGIAVHDSGV